MTDRAAPEGGERGVELRLARLHLRGGTYALARSELETLAGANRLDRDAVLDLAEVRWRTGDLPGAAAAAETWLADGAAGSGAPLILAHVICAEAAADRGRAGEAAAHVQAAADGLGDRRTLEAVLAGIVARAAWGWDETPAPGLPTDPGASVVATTPGSASAAPAAAAAAIPAPAPGVAEAPREPVVAAAELARAGASLVIAAPERAAVLLALAVRADAGAADAVLAALDGTDVGPAQAASFAFVRAEALRAAGRHEEARIAYAWAERLALAPAEAGPPGSSQ